jgi:hypothetical protein
MKEVGSGMGDVMLDPALVKAFLWSLSTAMTSRKQSDLIALALTLLGKIGPRAIRGEALV